ncbi:AraC family transcriptional regulator [Pedobacter sp. G11]|uniref:helix-turn-helix domain-containing protein n=1 Tax=Pedobacter sp. G11 TaxID=2482728 RepID=UPI000F5F6396|nr:AraC family transcriptional regulator [Pedobacter sp. G11]AZI27428.1 AraC family transcriptional regulator [Pedobacter sp. G11]
MSYKLDGSDFDDFLLYDQKVENEVTKPANGIVEHLKFVTPKGEITYDQFIVREDLSILHGNYLFGDNISVNGKGDSSLLEMHFNLSDQHIYYKNKATARDSVSAMAGNITFLTAEDNQAKIGFKENIEYNTFDIHLPFVTLAQYEGESKILDRFLNKCHKDISTVLAPNEIKIGAKEFCVIQDIKNCPYVGLTRRIYLESKVYELIALSFNGLAEEKENFKLTHSDTERIEFAAQLIRENLNKPFTIVELARKASINQTKLKEGFKSVFGNTVFGYLQEIRMNKARHYLLDKNLSVQEISYMVGYQNISNFSIAFKKTFGYPPTKLRSKM